MQVYSLGYMRGDPGFARFFSYLSLFSFSMLTLVLADNFILLYMAWELVGLCSYLLIGFWYQKPEAARAAKKAFVVTRVGDLGFLVGILVLSLMAGTFDFAGVARFIGAGNVPQGQVTLIVLLLFCGAVGKSGQFPLHVWLPDAMEGPTPVSALIHSATMVAAGVFMVARLYGIFQASPDALRVVAGLGAFTAVFAAAIALAQDDIKRILAYSTISQLGYMMLALGVGGYGAGLFHLTTHAAFKTLLFLGAGSVIHAVGTNDIRQMGGLGRRMPVTAGHLRGGRPGDCRDLPAVGFLEQGRDPGGGPRRRASGAVRRRARHRLPHGGVHVAPVLPCFAGAQRRDDRAARVAAGHDRAAGDSRDLRRGRWAPSGSSAASRPHRAPAGLDIGISLLSRTAWRRPGSSLSLSFSGHGAACQAAQAAPPRARVLPACAQVLHRRAVPPAHPGALLHAHSRRCVVRPARRGRDGEPRRRGIEEGRRAPAPDPRGQSAGLRLDHHVRRARWRLPSCLPRAWGCLGPGLFGGPSGERRR